jgi:hypothetical protein
MYEDTVTQHKQGNAAKYFSKSSIALSCVNELKGSTTNTIFEALISPPCFLNFG